MVCLSSDFPGPALWAIRPRPAFGMQAAYGCKQHIDVHIKVHACFWSGLQMTPRPVHSKKFASGPFGLLTQAHAANKSLPKCKVMACNLHTELQTAHNRVFIAPAGQTSMPLDLLRGWKALLTELLRCATCMILREDEMLSSHTGKNFKSTGQSQDVLPLSDLGTPEPFRYDSPLPAWPCTISACWRARC